MNIKLVHSCDSATEKKVQVLLLSLKFVTTNLAHRDDLKVDRSAEGNYSTELYGNRAAQIIRWDKGNKLTPPRNMAFTLTIALAGLTTRRKRQNSLKIQPLAQGSQPIKN